MSNVVMSPASLAPRSWYERLRPLLFSLPASWAHEAGMAVLSLPEYSAPVRSLLRNTLSVSDPRLEVRTMGLTFPNPLGVAAGFDKDGRRSRALIACGFGHVELGTVTAIAQRANPSPNLFRLPADEALLNRLGFPNRGAAYLAARLTQARPPVPVGISIGKSRVVSIDDLAAVREDYRCSFATVAPVADFVVVNVSSPNTPSLRTIQNPAAARSLLAMLSAARDALPRPVPLLLKVAPDLDDDALDALVDVVTTTGFQGVVAANTTIQRAGLRTPAATLEALGAGGVSGAPLRQRARAMVARIRKRLGPEKTIIGVGGVFNAADVQDLRTAGADLCQLYTGFIYQGPMIARDICRDLLT